VRAHATGRHGRLRPSGIAFDPANRTVAVANVEDTSVSVINAASNATVPIGCHSIQPSAESQIDRLGLIDAPAGSRTGSACR
jgi:DNA-binding beta-propeller fold protein YncE